MNTLLCLFGWTEPYEPDIIDPHWYESEILLQHDRDVPPMPPPGIHGRIDRDWTCKEMEAMRRNRRLLEEIYRRVKSKS